MLARTAPIGVVGQGYVGLSLACAAARAGFPVTGIDVDQDRVARLSAGELCVAGVSERLFRDGIDSGNLTFAGDASPVAEVRAVFICVPTPVRDHSPDLSFVEQATRDIAEHVQPSSLVVLESTTYPGTTNDIVRPLLETRGLSVGRDILLAYSPERIDPGNEEYGFEQVPRIVGGHSVEATGMAVTFYEQLVEKVIPVSSTDVAELAKLLENSFRHANIALVNEMAMLCHEMDIDVWEVIDAAASKPFGFMRFTPGPGVGGHCIPLDPTYLSWQVKRDVGRQFRMIEVAQDINAVMPGWVAERIGEALSDVGVPVRAADVLVLGVAYKPDIGDVRESPALPIMARLHRRGARVSFHDPLVPDAATQEVGFHRVELTKATLAAADIVVLITPHRSYDLDWIGEHASLVFDARSAYGSASPANVVRL